jgi:uncharacterized protein YecE (DUF72 family)
MAAPATSAWHELGERRAVLLVQLHAGHQRDDARREYFLARLPSWMRAAVEFRHPSWHDEEAFALLERRGEWSAAGRDVFVYFNNDGHGHAVRNAERLRELTGA